MVALDKYVTFKKGTLPLIISVPHGGSFKFGEIPTRKEGILGIDKGTIELAQELIELIERFSIKRFSLAKKPSILISNISRSKIDFNRSESEAFQNDSAIAKKIYHFYHEQLKNTIEKNIRLFKRSLLIEIHGFEKYKRPPGFRDVEIILGTRNLNTILPKPDQKVNLGENIRGKIINRFLKLGIPIAPGHPRRREYVLKGGFITQKYGANNITKSQSIQIEFSDRIRIHDKELRIKTLKCLAELLFNEIA